MVFNREKQLCESCDKLQQPCKVKHRQSVLRIHEGAPLAGIGCFNQLVKILQFVFSKHAVGEPGLMLSGGQFTHV